MSCGGCISIADLTYSRWGVECFSSPAISITDITLTNSYPLCHSEPVYAIRSATRPRLWIRNAGCVPVAATEQRDFRVGHIVPGEETSILGGDL